MTSALDLIGFTARVEHHPDPAVKDAPTVRFYVGMLQDGVEVVGRRQSIILIVGRNDVVLTWRKASACRPTHAALYERPAGGEPFDGNIGPAVAEVIDQHWIRDGDMVTLTWKITWTG
jgi:hypothetical protein